MKNVQKIALVFMAVLAVAAFYGCGSSSNTEPSGGHDAAHFATFGTTLSDAIPAALKEGGANIEDMIIKELAGDCAADFTGCPYITSAGGGDGTTGEILMRLWALDYNDVCTNALITDGTCFDCADCTTGAVGTTKFIIPTMLADPSECVTTPTDEGQYVNMGVDPRFFDTMIGNITNVDTCETVEGGEVSIVSAVPWYASWGIPENVRFSSYYAAENGNDMWWTVNEGADGDQEYFLSLSSDWLYDGIKDPAADEFFFFGTGSPSYYEGLHEGRGVNISAYAGTLSAIPAQFEAMQVRVQDEKYIERTTSNGEHVWYQSWSLDHFPETPDDVAGLKNNPSINRCVEIGDKIVTSKYVPLDDCVESFGKDSVADLNADDNYRLKVIDGETASSIEFTTSLTPDVTHTSCLESSSSL
jgi:hypothetical protein